MIPSFFPMTYLPSLLVRGLAACFEQTAIYQPSSRRVPSSLRAEADRGTLAIRIPASEEEEKLDGIVRAYREWAETHSGGEKTFLQAGAAEVPFYDEFSVHRIRTDLRERQAGEVSKEKPDPVFSARIFLCMAQEFDRHDWEAESDLSSYQAMEKDLIHHLRGGEEDEDALGFTRGVAGGGKPILRDPGARMTRDRLRAWARLVLSDPHPPGFWVTSSRAAVEQLADEFSEWEEAFRIDSIPVLSEDDPDAGRFRAELQEHLEKWMANPENPGPPPVPDVSKATEKVSLILYRAGISPRGMLTRLVDEDAAVLAEGKKAGEGADAVFIGLVETA